MKKIVSIAINALFAFMICLVISCSGEDLDYKKACFNKDWPKAYEIVDKLQDIAIEKNAKWREIQSDHGTESLEQKPAKDDFQFAVYKYEDAKRYVVLQESMSELEQGNLMRIAAIVKEQNAPWVYKELISIAKSIGEQDLVDKLTSMSEANNTKP